MTDYSYMYNEFSKEVTRTSNIDNTTCTLVLTDNHINDYPFNYNDCVNMPSGFVNNTENDFIKTLCGQPHYQRWLTRRAPFESPDSYLGFIMFFSEWVLPYENYDKQLKLRPKYTIEINNAYNKEIKPYSWIIRILEKLIRLLLIIPGLIIGPLFFIAAVLGLINWKIK